MSSQEHRPDWRDRLRQAVVRSGRKYAAIAWDAGISPETLSRILNTPQINPHFDTVVRLAQALQVRLGWLVGEPTGPELTPQDEKMLRAVLALVEDVINALENGRPITISRGPRT
jgi:DNA-binding phage protein